MERRATMIRTFTFGAVDRASVVLSDATKIRIDGASDTAQLAQQSDGTYPTAANINITSAIAKPASLRKLVAFQASARNFKNAAQALVTGEQYRLTDGTNQFFWNGSAWVVDTTHWNSEADIANNIALFSQAVTAKKFGVVVNLWSTDQTTTPQLIRIKIAFEVKQQSWMDDIFLRSLVRNLKAQVRPIAEIQWKHVGGNTVDVTTAVDACGVPFKFASLDSVFNFGADPGLETDLLQSITGGVATLSQTLAAGTILRLNVVYIPNVVVLTTSPDFVELDKLPTIIVEQIRTMGAQQALSSDEVINKSAGTAKQIKRPWSADLEFDIRAVTPNSTDLLRLVEALIDFADDNPTLVSQALDEEYRLQLIDEFDSSISSQGSGVCESTAGFRLHNVTLLRHSAVDTFAVQRVKVSAKTQNQPSPVLALTVTEASSAVPPVGSFPEE